MSENVCAENEIRLSVRNLVEFVMRSGDLDNRRGNGAAQANAMVEGTRIHRKIQKSRKDDDSFRFYTPEVSLTQGISLRGGKAFWEEIGVEKEEMILPPGEQITLILEGRADGIFIDEEDHISIEEIKGVYQNINRMEEPEPVHLAQAVCYGYMLKKCLELSGKDSSVTEKEISLPAVLKEELLCRNTANGIKIVVTYCNIETDELRQFVKLYTEEELMDSFARIVEGYGRFAEYLVAHRRKRNESIEGLEFPFPYRDGQRDVVVAGYKVIRMGRDLFVQAPTGIGKTLSTVYPSVKSMGEGLCDKIFYLTAKTITREVAAEAFDILQKRGLKGNALVLTAKEKICFYLNSDEEEKEEETEPVQGKLFEDAEAEPATVENKEKMTPDCNPVACSFAKGHFDRINDAIYDLITHEENISRQMIVEYALKYHVCPFEMSLDVSNWMDMIICDYNYCFDPHAKLQRYFGEGACKENFVFLIDEAHNLVERARDMYSAVLVKEDFLEAKRHYAGISKKISNDAVKCNSILLAMKRECVEQYRIMDPYEAEVLVMAVSKMYSDIVAYEEDHPDFTDREGAPFFFALRDFLTAWENIGDDYRIYTQHLENGNFAIRLYCVEPARQLGECIQMGRSAIFFSATMLPMRYYKEVLKGDNEDYAIYIRSPFDTRRRLLCVANDVTSKYSRRSSQEYEKICDYLISAVETRKGNYLAFFPSFAFMEEIRQILSERNPEFEWICQDRIMKDEKREEFLERFGECAEEGEALLGLCVTGGIFSEGIDLTGDRLIGVFVVGTGLPQVCPERQILRDYFDEKEPGSGFSYAYTYPGANRVMQAAGRLIRTADDSGLIVLMDYRFLNREYDSLFPPEWQENRIVVGDSSELEEPAKDFWRKIDAGLAE